MRFDDPARPTGEGGAKLQANGAPLPVITLVTANADGSWLACIHAERGRNRFGYHSGRLGDLGTFSREWLKDPEEALAKYFGYKGPEEAEEEAKPRPAPRARLGEDFWGDPE